MDRLWSAAVTTVVDRSELHRPAVETILAVRHSGLNRHRRPLVVATTIAHRVQDRPLPLLWASLHQVIILITHITTIITWPLTCPSRKWACTTPQQPPPLPNTIQVHRPCIWPARLLARSAFIAKHWWRLSHPRCIHIIPITTITTIISTPRCNRLNSNKTVWVLTCRCTTDAGNGIYVDKYLLKILVFSSNYSFRFIRVLL